MEHKQTTEEPLPDYFKIGLDHPNYESDTSKEEKCKPDGLSYTSIPPQSKCKICSQMWFSSNSAPICKVAPDTSKEEKWIEEFDRDYATQLQLIKVQARYGEDIEQVHKLQQYYKDLVVNLKSFIKEQISQARKEERKRTEKMFDSFNLMDWSGEGEVYAEIERLKQQIINSEEK